MVDQKLALGARGLRAGRHDELLLVVAEKRRRGRREARVDVGVADALDAIRGGDELVGHRRRDVAAALRRQVDRHAAGLHHVDHVLRDEHGRLAARDLRSGDDDVDLLALLLEHDGRGVEPLLRHLLGVPARALARLLEIDLQKLAAHRLDLLLHGRTDVKAPDDRSHVLGGLDGREASHAAAEDEDLGRRHLAGGSHLAAEEAPELIRSLDDRAVARDVSLGREHVEGLAAAEGARDAIHSENGRFLLGQLLHQLRVLRRLDHTARVGVRLAARVRWGGRERNRKARARRRRQRR
mmetsp:Transcript_68616/g.191179  ORF Transcript_68616/g.191179 Transcript_68616/m.191179 type:complete len:296 (-) Transcript_68616:581-1468(-)